MGPLPLPLVGGGREDPVMHDGSPRTACQQPPPQRTGTFAGPTTVEQPGNVQVFVQVTSAQPPIVGYLYVRPFVG